MSLFESICSYNNLLLGFERVEENGGTSGVDNITIERFSAGLQTKLVAMQKQLLSGAYEPFPLRKVSIPKANGKLRWLSIPTVRDRIIQTSASIVLTPLIDPEFEESSFAYRKNRSVKKAIHKINELREKGYIWVVDADIFSFFDEINHEILTAELAKYIDDTRVLDLIYKWIKADVVYKGQKTALAKGVPQGSPISPLLSNVYLDVFDEALMKANYKHVRFADDFVILCKDKPTAEDALELTEDVLSKLNLNVNLDKTRITSFNQGFRYLGVSFLRSMIFRPQYTEDLEINQLLDESTPKNETRNEHRLLLSALPDTVMAKAFKQAVTESGGPEILERFHAKPEIEPTAFGDPFLRTLYILEQGAVLAKEDERFKIIKDKQVIKEIPAIKVDQILIFGNIQITTQAMKFCLEHDIPLILLSSTGKYFGSVESFKKTRVVLHKKQFSAAEDINFSLTLGRAIVAAKINNSKVVAQRYIRKRKHMSVAYEITQINILLAKIPFVSGTEELMGIEGAAAARYFSVIRNLIDEGWGFKQRLKQPPPDPVNSLLSYGYTLLFYNIYAMVRMHGLHPYIGFLHGIRDGHPALVSDIIEEFRAPVVDSTVLNMLLRGSLKKEDFIIPEEKGAPCLLSANASRVFIKAFEAKMNSAVTHAPTGLQVDYRRCIDLQVQALKKALQGNMPQYEPMTIK